MSDPFSWSIRLGRWLGVDVRLHALLLAYAALVLLDAALSDGASVAVAAAWLSLLLLALLLHELAHLLVARQLGAEPVDIRLWPLGNFIRPSRTPIVRPAETVVIAAAGLILSGTIALSIALALRLGANAQMVFHPFGNALGSGAPLLADGETPAAPFSAIWWAGWFGYLNWILFLANLIPALPMDMGRILRALTENPWSDSHGRDNLVATWTGRVCSILLVMVGLIWIVTGESNGFVLIGLGVLLYMVARLETRVSDEETEYGETLFGYDFSQGYTSLEGGAATVRPVQEEGALTRWRRRRSELRRQRAETRAAAEEQRMDEILAKIHDRGSACLTSEEQRFLMRVSTRYRSRTRPAP